MKPLILPILLLKFVVVFSQVGIGTVNPDISSVLDIESSDKGILIPRMTRIDKNNIVAPADGLLVYQTNEQSGFWYFDGTVWQPFQTNVDAENGLYVAPSGEIRLGQTPLIEETNIDARYYSFNIQTNSRANMMHVDNFNNVVKFGHDSVIPIFDDNSTYVVDGFNITVDFVTSVNNGASNGSATGVGSIEYLLDGENSTALNANFVPTEDDQVNLGLATNRWQNIFLTNAPVITSDLNLKDDIKPISYGLNEILQLETISYRWKNNKIGNTTIPKDIQEVHLGFSAQNLQAIIPEAVKTHSWKIASEATKEFKKVKNDYLAVKYSELIPVLTKAIQEHQKQIEALKEELDSIKN